MKGNPTIDSWYIFSKSPSLEALEMRLRNRGTENEEDIQKKFARAKAELEYADSQGNHDKIIINDNIEKAYEERPNDQVVAKN